MSVLYAGKRLFVRWVSPSEFREEALEDESFGRWFLWHWKTERHVWFQFFGLELSWTKKTPPDPWILGGL